MRSEKRKIGDIGENIFAKHLVKHNYKILDRNYSKKWGEIDIIAQKDNIIYFVEVKTVTRENVKDLKKEVDGFQPEENVHPMKLRRMGRVIQTYLIEKDIEEVEWQFDVMAVFLDIENKQARVRVTENVVI